jgi:hypothetical protein
MNAKFMNNPKGIPIKFMKNAVDAITSINPKGSKIFAATNKEYNPLSSNIEAKINERFMLKLKMQKIADKISINPKITTIISFFSPNNMKQIQKIGFQVIKI